MRIEIHILPMRNWNIPQTFALHRGEGFTSYLWGIETWCYRPGHERVYGFTSYLWGIETLLKVDQKAVVLSIHILPMRNWNTTLWSWRNESDSIHILPMRNWNQNMHSLTMLGSEYSHPTYEELKLIGSWTDWPGGFQIHILPMRNWNYLSIVVVV